MAARLATLLVAAIVATTLIAGLIVGAQRDDNSGPVDLIVHNAKVYAADDLGSTAEAIAIRGNKILKVGSEREIMRYRRPQTTLLDARGGTVLPGFDDAHAALVAGGLSVDAVQLFGARSFDDVRERLEAFATAHADAAWIRGYGWSYDAIAEPTRLQLDAVVTDRPVALLSQDGHALWVNTRALAAAGLAKRTPALRGAAGVVRDRRGDATGLVRDGAMALVERAAPRPTREERANALQTAIREAQRRGVTSLQDFGAAPGDLDLYDAARDAGTLGLRVYAAVPAASAPDDLDSIARRFPDDPLLKTGLASLPLDGSVESQTAAMLAPYAPRGAADGALNVNPPELSRLVSALDARGWQIAIEASGDRAVRTALDAVAAIVRPTGQKAARHRIEGLGVIDAEDVPRFGALGVVASMQPLHATADSLSLWSRNLGPERVAAGWPARSLSASGAHLAFGSDWPRLPLDPLTSIRAAVARAESHASEQLTLKSAINAWTSGGAWASSDDHRKGTLKAGRLADLVILSTDVFGSPQKLDAAEVVMTIFDGRIVYRRPS
jgi:predicted amidohydrolase YtcJ